ncbi:uncharacterized protein METZ01_LOCUS63816 [marine metagenome]|uniref:Uncharacterized protein n=1 Tax=marine metagenome TaxID=408172 RepID=A0A381T421_9ZZZZ
MQVGPGGPSSCANGTYDRVLFDQLLLMHVDLAEVAKH